MTAQGSTWKGFNSVPSSPSTTQSIFEAQMNAYISYSGWGVTAFSLVSSVMSYNQDPILLLQNVNSWSGDFTWVSLLVPSCAVCPEGEYGLIGDTSIPIYTTSNTYRSLEFYYSGSSIPQGYYRFYSTFSSTGMRNSVSSFEYSLGSLVCPTPTPTPTNTGTPTLTPTTTETPTQTSTETPTPTPTGTSSGETPTPTPTNTNTPSPTSEPYCYTITTEQSAPGECFDCPGYFASTTDTIIEFFDGCSGNTINAPFDMNVIAHYSDSSTGTTYISGGTVGSVVIATSDIQCAALPSCGEVASPTFDFLTISGGNINECCV
jgi:hypothetical protein